MRRGGNGSKRTRRSALAGAACLLILGGAVLAAAPAAHGLSIVNLSGTLRMGTTPQAGSVVAFNGASDGQSVNVSTTTDANGHWVLHPLSGSTGTLTINDGVVSGSVNLSVGSSDQVEDVALPTGSATGVAEVVDGDGNPLTGVQVTASVLNDSFVASGATSDGSPLSWGFPSFQGLPLCKTDATGTCTYPTFLNASGTLRATVTDPYGSDTSYPTTFTGSTSATIVADPTSATIVVDLTHSLVTLSGTVTSDGSPVAGAAVSFDGLSTTSDSQGDYTLHPFANSSDTLSVAAGATATSMPLSVGTTDDVQDVSLPPPAHLVNLSGTIYLGSAAAGGATVTLGGITTTADPSGHYSLMPAAGTNGTLQVRYLSNLYFASAPVVIGSTDQTDDLTIPSGPVTLNIDVIDSAGNPVAGAPVTGQLDSQTSSVLGSTSDGSPVTWGVNVTTAPFTVCTTGADGTCSAASALNLEGTLTAAASPFGSDSSYPQELTDSVTASTTTDPENVTLTVPTASVVALSGTATFNGNPLSGATVSLGGIHTTTDANGNYVLHPFAGTNGTIAVDKGLIHATFPVIVGNQDQSDDLPISDPNLVTLSGAVLLGSASNPDGPGAGVSFAGVSTTTDAAGHYSMVVPAGASGTLTTSGIINTSSALTVGTTDQTEDLTIPTSPTTATIRAVDGAGNALPDVVVHASVSPTPSPVTGTTSSGETLTWWVLYQGACTTGSDGTCTFAGLTNIVGTVSASHQLVPGDPSYPTLQTSSTGSAPIGGSLLTLAFPNVGYVPSAGSATGSVLLATTSGNSTIQGASSTSVPTSLLPSGVSAPVGSISYAVHSVPVGGSIDVYLQLPGGTVPSAIYKLGPDGTLTDVTSLATISGSTVTMHLTDGGPGDADGVANGVIVDPLIPVTGTVASGFRVATAGLPSAARGHPITPVALTVAGATPGGTLAWKKVSLPKGLKLSSAGLLTGIPSTKLQAGTAQVSVKVTQTVVTRVGKKKVKTVSIATATLPLHVS